MYHFVLQCAIRLQWKKTQSLKMLTRRIIAGVPNTCAVTLADSGRNDSISCVRSTGSDWLFSPATGDVLRGGTESANFWPMTDRWMRSDSCDWWWNKDENSEGLSADRNTLPELRSDILSLSLLTTQQQHSTFHLDQTCIPIQQWIPAMEEFQRFRWGTQINTKIKARLACLLLPLAWKQNGAILTAVNK